MSGADLSNLVNEAALFAVRAGEDAIHMHAFSPSARLLIHRTKGKRMAKCPFAQWMPLPWSAGHYVAGPYKIVHHTTEGSTAAGAFATYQQSHDIPHFTVDEQFIYQHLDTDVAARALAHPAGTVETNRHSAIQFELVGFAGRPKKKASLTNVGRLCRWIESTHGVPPEWPNGYPNPPVNGRDPGHHNRNEQNWKTKGGHYGHCHGGARARPRHRGGAGIRRRADRRRCDGCEGKISASTNHRRRAQGL